LYREGLYQGGAGEGCDESEEAGAADCEESWEEDLFDCDKEDDGWAPDEGDWAATTGRAKRQEAARNESFDAANMGAFLRAGG